MRPDLEDWAEQKFRGNQDYYEWYVLKYYGHTPMAQRIKTRRFIYKIIKKNTKAFLCGSDKIYIKGK